MEPMTAVMATDEKMLHRSERAVLKVLRDGADGEGRLMVSISQLIALSGYSRRAVTLAVARLKELGKVSVEHRTQDGVALPNVYTVLP